MASPHTEVSGTRPLPGTLGGARGAERYMVGGRITVHRIPPPEPVCPECGPCRARGASVSGGDVGKFFHIGHYGLFLMPDFMWIRVIHNVPGNAHPGLQMGGGSLLSPRPHQRSPGLQAAWMVLHTPPWEVGGEGGVAGADRRELQHQGVTMHSPFCPRRQQPPLAR